MSGICGILRFDGRPVSTLEMQHMAATLTHRGPDGIGLWQDGPVGLGHLMLWTTVESLGEQLPLHGANGNFCLTAEARLDNRKELLESLEISRRSPAFITDAELILAAYEKWGEDCVNRLLGDFAVALWDARKRTLFCARDRFGVKPLFYYHDDRIFAFASEIKALLSLPEIGRDLNLPMIGDHLAGTLLEREKTFYRDILRVQPAHVLMVNDRGMRERLYWQLSPDRELKLNSDGEYLEAFRERFNEAVECRLPSAFSIGATLSGGLDSSSIVCTAQPALSRQGANPLLALSVVFDELPECDERNFIATVAARYPIKSRYVIGDDIKPLTDLEQATWYADHPILAPNLSLHRALFRTAKEERLRVLLDGFDGDTVVSHGNQYLNELACRKQWVKLAVEIRALSRTLGFSPWDHMSAYVRHFGVNPLIARHTMLARAQRLWRRLRRPSPSKVTKITPAWQEIIDQEFASRIDLSTRYQDWRKLQPGSAESEREGHLRTLTQPNMPMAFEILDSAAAAFGVEPRYPFWDCRLVEFCLSLPPEQKLRHGLGRSIMRRALQDRLPPGIQHRADKTDFMPVLYNGLSSVDRVKLDQFMADGAVLTGYVNPEALQNLYSRITANKSVSLAQDLLCLWRILSLGEWLDAVTKSRGGERRVNQKITAASLT